MPMTVKEALARRDELLAQEAQLLERVDEIHVERERIRRMEDPPPEWARSHQIPRLPTMAASSAALAQARIDEARSMAGAAGEVERLEAHIADVEQRLQDGLDAEAVLREALEEVRADLQALYVDESQTWFEYAETFTARAHELLDALREPMADAQEAWQAAAAEWKPIAAANGLSAVQRCPLPPAGAVFGASEPKQPVDGAMLVFEPVDPADERERMTVEAGSGMHDALRTDPAWQRAGGQGAHGPAPVARPVDVGPVEEEASAA